MKKLSLVILLAVPFFIMAQEKVREVTYLNDKDLVMATYFHDNGEISQVGTYNTAGELHGKWESFDASGKRVALGTYLDGKKHGKWFFWNQDGLREVDFNLNSIASVSQWKEATAIVSNR
jgi:antitoxin component YwqK of YwqJK toxin-antitoxin module